MRSLLLASVFVVAALGISYAATPGPDTPTLRVEYFRADSARAIATWLRPCDGKGCADSYQVKWAAGVQARQVSTAALADTFRLATPTWGDSLLVTVTVTSVRRLKLGAPRSATGMIRNPDAPPPPVDSLKVDTVPRVDSTRLVAYSSSGQQLSIDSVLINEHDSVLFIQKKWFRPGTVRKDSTSYEWRGSPLPLVRYHALDRHGDSTWVIAMDCNCRSGGPGNPPRLNLRTAQWEVRDAAGRAVEADPEPADPFHRVR